MENLIVNMGMKDWVEVAKKWTARYAKTHKGRNTLEKECIKKGYVVARYGEIFKDCIESERNRLGIFALDFNTFHRKGGFVLVK